MVSIMKETSMAGERMRHKGAIGFLREILKDLGAEAGARVPPDSDGTANDTAASVRLGDVVGRLDERAFGMMLLLLALPCCLPFVYVLPQIVALPMLALAVQLAAGRRDLWLPSALANRRFDATTFVGVLDKSEKYVGWVEAIARPRLTGLTTGPGVRLIGLFLLAPCASILVPLPGTNTVPGIGVAIAALGLIERDGVLTCLGVLLGVVWVGLLLVFGLEAVSLLKASLGARL